MLSYFYEFSSHSGPITGAMFGANLVSQYDPTGTYENVANAAGVTTVRWPGGSDAERNTKVEPDPVPYTTYENNGAVDSAYTYLHDTAVNKYNTYFDDAVTFAGDTETPRDIAFIVPTLPLILGNDTRQDLKDYLTAVRDIAGAGGVTISSLEIGNEFWYTPWTNLGLVAGAAQYGEAAAYVAEVIGEVFADASVGGPEVLIQIWGDAKDGDENVGTAKLEQINQSMLDGYTGSGGNLGLIDGVAAHFYYKPGKTYGPENTTHSYDTIDERIAFSATC